MAKIIVAYCDGPNHDDDERVAGTPVRIALDDAAAQEVDLCDDCRKELVSPLADLLADLGQPVQKATSQSPSRNSVRKSCPECGSEFTRDGMRKHLRGFHDKEVMEVGNIVRSLFGSKRHQAGQLLTCPECGDEFDTPQGRGAHRKQIHGVSGPSKPAKKKPSEEQGSLLSS